MGGRHEARIEQLHNAILNYVRTHPDASDTPLGIVKWWLPEYVAEGAVEIIDDVLDDLAKAGALQCVRLPDGGLLYSAGTTRGRAVDPDGEG